MLYPGWIEREGPLARCPRRQCRRSNSCMKAEGPLPCERTHETKDAFHLNLAKKIERINEENLRRHPELRGVQMDQNSLAFELKLKALKEMLHASDLAACARQKALEDSKKPARARSSGAGRAKKG